ncbi:MAG: hypothetical protein GY757_50960, partial [bacterium]|nr:hypothetical protein [bacterium]
MLYITIWNNEKMTAKKQKISAKKKKKPDKREYDSAWKKVIRTLLKDFFDFFFPEIHDAIDFTKPVTFLDKELKEIDPDSTLGDRVADVLVKVHLKDSSEVKYISIITHIEVQGDYRKDFMKRMFIYYYRAVDKEQKEDVPVISVAILTGDKTTLTPENKENKPGELDISFLGFQLFMKIPTVEISDYKLKKELMEKLENSTKNPMSMVVKAQLKSHEVKNKDADKKFEVVKELIRQCYENGYTKEETHVLLNFFDWCIRLPKTYKEKVKNAIKQSEEDSKMDYVPRWAGDWVDEGREKGRKEGKKGGRGDEKAG